MILLKNQNSFLLIILLFLGIGCDAQSENILIKSTNENVEVFQSIIDSIYNLNTESVGLMVHIESPKNGISWSGSSGYSDKNKAKLSPNQPALIASSIKTYISAAVLRLQEDNKLTIEDNISQYLSSKTLDLFHSDGYDFNRIKIKHLLSHTSGITDYVNEDYLEWIDQNQNHRWTRDEQLQLATKVGSPIGKAQESFAYADVNFLLCTEIIEQITKKPFYTAIRELLKYEELNLSHTWFPTLEEKPVGTEKLVHQYWNVSEWGPNKIDIHWDSHEQDISWDLYGGGGIAANSKELAQFSYNLFNGNIIENEEVLELIKTEVKTIDGVERNYRLGVAEADIKGLKCYGHGGFWGTIVFYLPQLDASISVCVLERNGKMKVIRSTLNGIVTELSDQLYPAKHISSENYELHKAKNSQATLILFPGGGATALDIKREFDVVTAAASNKVSVLFMNSKDGLWMDKNATKLLSQDLETICIDNKLNSENVFIGGMSIGGNVALTLSNYLKETKNSITPKGTLIVDSPIDLFALYQSSIKDISNPDFDEERLAEPRWIANYFEEEFSKDSLLNNIQIVSPFTVKNKNTSVPNLKNCKVRFYTEPDSLWYKEVRKTDFESTNAYSIQQVAKDLKSKNWQQFELIETENKGYRSNGERHPHSWSIVDVTGLMEWILE